MKKVLYVLGSFIIVLLIGINAIFYYENMYVKNFIPTSSEVSTNTKKPANQQPKKVVNTVKQKPQQPKEYKATLNFLGDVFFNGYLLKSYYDRQNNTYKFDDIFSNVKDIVYGDLNIFKFDSIVSSNYPVWTYNKYNAPSAVVQFLKDSGLNVAILSSYHIFDGKKVGLEDTIKNLENANIDYVGAKSSNDDQKSKIFDVNNIRVGIAAFSKELTGIYMDAYSSYKDYINILDKDSIKNELEYLKSLNCDVIIAYANWGYEHSINPTSEQKEFAKELVKYGADIVIGTHTHTIQPFEKIQVTDDEGKTKEGIVFYSLGNFLCDQTVIFPYNRFGLAVKLELTKKDDNISKKINVEPIYIFRRSRTNGYYYDFSILKARDILNRTDVRRSYIQYATKLLKNIEEWSKNIQ